MNLCTHISFFFQHSRVKVKASSHASPPLSSSTQRCLPVLPSCTPPSLQRHKHRPKKNLPRTPARKQDPGASGARLARAALLLRTEQNRSVRGWGGVHHESYDFRTRRKRVKGLPAIDTARQKGEQRCGASSALRAGRADVRLYGILYRDDMGRQTITVYIRRGLLLWIIA